MELFHLSPAAPDGRWSEPGSTSSHLEAAPTPAEFEGTGPVLNLSGRHRMLCLDKHCSKQHKIAPIHMDSACTCYLQLLWTVTELTASLFWAVFREYVRLSNGVELSSCNPNNILSLHEYWGRVFPIGDVTRPKGHTASARVTEQELNHHHLW